MWFIKKKDTTTVAQYLLDSPFWAEKDALLKMMHKKKAQVLTTYRMRCKHEHSNTQMRLYETLEIFRQDCCTKFQGG